MKLSITDLKKISHYCHFLMLKSIKKTIKHSARWLSLLFIVTLCHSMMNVGTGYQITSNDVAS